MSDWFTKDRSETAANRADSRSLNGITVSNPALGINVYEGAIESRDCEDHINTLESHLNGQTQWAWSGAYVTTSDQVDLEARNAKDFKFNSTGLGPTTSENEKLYKMHESIFQKVRKCMDDYGRYWGVGINSYEAFNFVKYEGAGTHFKIHADHGPTYVATISVVVYLNENFEGGELYFPRFDLKYKPKTGDIVIFPSTYIYEHASEDMISGTKYSVVIMTDYHDRDNVNRRVSQTVEQYKLTY